MAITDLLVSHWKLDEASGNRPDTHGASTLTSYNSVPSTTGKYGSAALFNGTTNSRSLAVASTSSFLATGSFFVSAWVQLASKPADNTAIICKWHYAAGVREWFLGWVQASDRLGFQVAFTNGTRPTVTWNSAPALNTWYHVLGWYDASAATINVRINGGTAQSLSVAGLTPSTGNADVSIGAMRQSADNFWNGPIDSVSFGRGVLSAQQQLDIANDYPFETAPGLIASASQAQAAQSTASATSTALMGQAAQGQAAETSVATARSTATAAQNTAQSGSTTVSSTGVAARASAGSMQADGSAVSETRAVSMSAHTAPQAAASSETRALTQAQSGVTGAAASATGAAQATSAAMAAFAGMQQAQSGTASASLGMVSQVSLATTQAASVSTVAASMLVLAAADVVQGPTQVISMSSAHLSGISAATQAGQYSSTNASESVMPGPMTPGHTLLLAAETRYITTDNELRHTAL